MKKALSALLAAALCVCCANIAFAQSEEPVVYEEILCNRITSDLIAVLTYDGTYTQIGDAPVVTLQTASQEKTVPAENILRQVFFYEGAYYPQLFIRLPESDETKYTESNAVLCVSAGAFQDDAGVDAPAFSKEIDRFQSAEYDIRGFCDRSVSDVSFKFGKPTINYIIAGSTVTTTYEQLSWKYGDVWESASKLYVGDEEAGAEYIAREAGTYTLTGKLNEFVWDAYTFTALDEKQARRQGIRAAFNTLVFSPVMLVYGIGTTVTFPGLGWVLGPAGVLAALVSPFELIYNLFHTPYEKGMFL